MSTPGTKPAPFPIGAAIVNALGGLLIAAGLVGLFAPEILTSVPALKDPATAWTLVGVGIALDVGAACTIVSHLRSRRPAG